MFKANYLAPVKDYTNLPFRLLAQKHGAKATVVPLVSAIGIARNSKALQQVDSCSKERFAGVQLFGSEPSDFLKAGKAIVKNFEWVKWIDINAGCPARDVIKCGGGAALLEKPELAKRIVAALKKCGLPVSVKMRLCEKAAKTLEFAKAVQGADFITVHGRTVKQGYAGSADWTAIKRVKEACEIPVVGNGDIKSTAQGDNLVRNGFCDAFMIGRAALSNPLVFQGREASSSREKRSLFMEYISLAEKYSCLELQDLKLKGFEFFRGLPGSASLRAKLATAKTIDELMGIARGLGGDDSGQCD